MNRGGGEHIRSQKDALWRGYHRGSCSCGRTKAHHYRGRHLQQGSWRGRVGHEDPRVACSMREKFTYIHIIHKKGLSFLLFLVLFGKDFVVAIKKVETQTTR